ncbi:RNF10 family protein [Megaselia abdita]
MDKKTQQTFSRGSNKTLQQSDSSRKTNDSIQSSKPWPKNPRRRENKNLSSFNKPEAQRNGPGKNRLFVDKRPKPRSSFSNDPTSTSTSGLGVLDIAAESEGSIDYEIELNSIYTPGSKKQNLNHLLNFNYVPREDSHNVFGRFGGSGGNNYRKSNIKKPKYNKEQYLQANFQFVINTTADQHLLTSCPDTLIDWKLIEQINIQTTEEPQCPICLFPPIAAKLTRCGHVYCWPCILHYLALSDKTWRKCPICYEAVHHVDLKSTAIIQQSNFNVGSEITFKLMSRKKGSMVIEKGIPEKKGSEKIIHLSENNENRNFSKFLISDVSEILSIIEREKTELLFDQDPDCPEFVFIQQALGFLEQRKNEVLKEASYSSSSSIENINQLGSVDEENDKYYYFYQSEDAQNIFLHPLNIKMLQTMYNSLSEAPEVIKGKILQKESQSMDDILRRKFTCLGHLPLTCQFEIVEIEIKYPYVSKEVSDAFKDSTRLLFATWWIFITILTSFYTANLTAFLTLSRFTLPFNTVADILRAQKQFVTSRGGGVEYAIKNYNEQLSMLKPLVDKNIALFVDDQVDEKILKDYVEKKGFVFVRDKPAMSIMLYNDYMKRRTLSLDNERIHCPFAVAKAPFMTKKRGFVYPIGSNISRLFDKELLNLVELGIVKHLASKDVPNAEICPLNLGGTERQLRITDLMMTFYIMVVGFATAIVVFSTELFFKFMNAKKIQQDDWQFNPAMKRNKNYDWDNVRDKMKSNFGNYNLTPPPPYASIYSGINTTSSNSNLSNQPNYSNQLHGVKRLINGRDYLVFKNKNGESQLIPVRAPSATLFQYSYTE